MKYLGMLYVYFRKIKDSIEGVSVSWDTESPFSIASVLLVLGVIVFLVWLVRKLLTKKI
jgi:hypothetical protein